MGQNKSCVIKGFNLDQKIQQLVVKLFLYRFLSFNFLILFSINELGKDKADLHR